MALARDGRWVYGVHAVEECLRRTPGRVRQVRLLPHTERLRGVAGLALAAGIPVGHASPAELRRLSGGGRHQGCAAEVADFPYASLEDVVARKDRGPVLLASGVEDPRNLGALLRVAAAVEAAGVILPRRRATGVTPAAEKAAAGTAGVVPVCRVTNAVRAVEALRGRGFWIAGLAARGGGPLFETELPEPLAIVVGGEQGLGPLLERSCDVRVTIPMAPGVESLNLSVAAALVLYEVVRRRGPRRAEERPGGG